MITTALEGDYTVQKKLYGNENTLGDLLIDA